MVTNNVPAVVISPWIKGGWKTNTAFHCAMVPCGNVNPTPGPLAVQVLRTTQYCWTVGGSAALSAKTGLAVALLGELALTVEVNNQTAHCETRTDGITGNVPANQCFNNSGRWIYKDATATGTREWASVVYYWKSINLETMVQCGSTVQTDCGRTTATGKADRVWEEVFQIARPRQDCGGPPSDPLFDGKYMEPCCQPMVGCPIGTQPPSCCGCYATP